jgi:F-type H+-transporting ATPase subunit b
MKHANLVTLALLMAFAGPLAPVSWAAEVHEGGAKATVNIFDPADIPLGIWTIVVFVILLVVLKKFAWGPILEGLQKREQTIQTAIEEAQKARDEAQRMREQWQREVDQAHVKVAAILDEGRRNAKTMTDEMIAKARSEIQGERDRLRREIENAKDQAVQEIWNQAALLATAISAKAIRRQISAEDHRRLVDEALAELKKTGSA